MSEAPSLLRKKAVEHQKQNPFGKVLCVGPTSTLVLSLLLSLAFFLLLLFLWLGYYQPEVRVSGVLVPNKGMDYVYAPATGTVSTISVKKSDQLEKGTSLFSIQIGNSPSGMAPTQQQLQLINNQIALQKKTLDLQKKQLHRLEELKKNAAVSETTLQAQQQVVLNTQVGIKQLQQQYMVLMGEQITSVTAPETGLLASLLVSPGMHVSQNQPLAVILPENSITEAQLFVPSSAMRSIHVGQEVFLRYSAYPWQQYGIYTGKVISIDNVLFEPGEIRYTRSMEQSFFLVKVRPEAAFVNVNNRHVSLRPGMQLSASLLLPKVTLWRWIFHPLA